jgi:hypothetical protein
MTFLNVLGRLLHRHHYHHSRRPRIHQHNRNFYHLYNYTHRRICLIIFELFAIFIYDTAFSLRHTTQL